MHIEPGLIDLLNCLLLALNFGFLVAAIARRDSAAAGVSGFVCAVLAGVLWITTTAY